jgi:hypothetical protein
MAMPCKSSLPEDSHHSVTGIGRSPENREIRMTTPVSSVILTLDFFRVCPSLALLFHFLAFELRDQEDSSKNVEDVNQGEQADCNDKRVFRG